MGQQQLLLLILGVIVVGIAVTVGITLFGAHSTEANKDGVTTGIMAVAASAYEYKIRPATLGGGRPSYVGYSIPSKLRSDENGSYEIVGSPTSTQVQLRAISSMDGSWTASCTVDSLGSTTISYSGW